MADLVVPFGRRGWRGRDLTHVNAAARFSLLDTSMCTAMADNQQEVIRFLSRPSSYGPGIERVEIVETHISLIFLAGERAYKLKRAVVYPYLDFSTAERRRQACAAELSLNRRTAPALYLDLRAIGRTPEGSLGFVSQGAALDWVVVMRRFDQALLFDALAREGRLNAALMQDLTDRIAAFHAAAERRFDYGGAAALHATIAENHDCLAAAPPQVGFIPQQRDAVRDRSLARLAALGPLLDRRRAEGKVRRVHGDLHLRNIVLLDGAPVLFDCIEFSETLATIDILYDLAFLLMDLEHRGLGEFANRVLNRYLDLTGEDDGLPAMPLFLSVRAAIRAHVIAAATRWAAPAAQRDAAAEARRYLDLAARFLEPRPRRLVAIGGLSGTGKSTLAAALAALLGARVLRSDVIRKRLFGVPPETRLPASAYSAEISQQVYRRLREMAKAALEAGYSVIIDAVALRPQERQSFAAVAAAAAVPFCGLWLEAPAETLASRLAARRNDASDASLAVLERQLRRDPGPIAWTRINAAAAPQQCLAAARRAVVPE
jgi:aminoglycoside phosphotransferase family enzyme/predicted kinase